MLLLQTCYRLESEGSNESSFFIQLDLCLLGTMLSRFSMALGRSAAVRRSGVSMFSTLKGSPIQPEFSFEIPDDVKTKQMYKDVIEYQLRNASPEVQQEAINMITESTYLLYVFGD